MSNHQISANRRNPAVDIARGLGILCVVWGHMEPPLAVSVGDGLAVSHLPKALNAYRKEKAV